MRETCRCAARLLCAGIVIALVPAPGWAQNPFAIDGVITDASNSGVASGQAAPNAQATRTLDPAGSNKELGPVNASTTKLGVIHAAPPPMLAFTNPNGQVDLNAVWTQTAMSGGHIWYYFAWSRDANKGSGFLAIEMQQTALATGCVYTNVDQTSETSAADLIATCNPWQQRKAGDFLILWDQSGSSTAIYKRVFAGVAPNLTLGPAIELGSAVAAFSTDNFRGEAAIDMTEDVFPPDAGCVTIANTIPTTVTGNSDTADYKDTVLSAFAPISNCGLLTVTKVTQDPNGTPLAGTGTFPYTVDRTGGGYLRFSADAANFPNDTLTAITRTLTSNGDSETHTNLLPGTDYRVVEDTATMGAQWTLVSIACTVAGSQTQYTGAAFPIVVNALTSCTITNRYVRTLPAQTTAQLVRLFDSIAITSIQPTQNRASSVTFRLYADGACTTQVGTDITAALVYSQDGTAAQATTFATVGIPVTSSGTFYWRVEYPGDLLNTPFNTTCTEESTTITLVQPTP